MMKNINLVLERLEPYLRVWLGKKDNDLILEQEIAKAFGLGRTTFSERKKKENLEAEITRFVLEFEERFDQHVDLNYIFKGTELTSEDNIAILNNLNKLDPDIKAYFSGVVLVKLYDNNKLFKKLLSFSAEELDEVSKCIDDIALSQEIQRLKKMKSEGRFPASNNTHIQNP